MSTDLPTALRDAVTDAPSHPLDAQSVIAAGGRRIRRRSGIAVTASALAVAAVLVTVAVVNPQRADREPMPAEIVRLDLDQATPLQPDLVASTRTTWRGAGRKSLEYDRLNGITADGLILRSRYLNAEGATEIGLLDPATGSTEWLPPAPGSPSEVTPLDLAVDRFVLAERRVYGQNLLIFNRATRTWQRYVVTVSRAMEVHVPPRLVLSPDDRLWVGATMEGESGPIHWWSAALDKGGQAREEHGLTGSTIAWTDGRQVTADPDGRVVVSGSGEDTLVGDRRPAGCDKPEEYPDWPVLVTLAGDRPVVTYICETGTDLDRAHTVVYDPGGETQIEIAGASVLDADDQHVVVAGDSSPTDDVSTGHLDGGSTYVVDLAALTINRVGPGPHEPQVDLVDGLLLWNSPGHRDDNSVYDVTWQVARVG